MKRLTYNVITGSDRELGLYFYYSPHFDQNIVRRTTSLTGNRVKKDPAFKGFRESGSRMKQASPIAASLYKLVPAELKQYSIYRLLTGEALKMLKAGFDQAVILDELRRIHIEPLLHATDKERNRSEKIRDEEAAHEGRLKRFIKYPVPESRVSYRMKRRKEHRLPVRNGQAGEFQNNPTYSNLSEHPGPSETENVFSQKLKQAELHIKRPKKTKDLTYLCRLPACKKLKIWLRTELL
jgi:hypothetical protein